MWHHQRLLHFASHKGEVGLVNWLLRQKARPGSGILCILCEGSPWHPPDRTDMTDTEGNTPLVLCAKSNHVEARRPDTTQPEPFVRDQVSMKRRFAAIRPLWHIYSELLWWSKLLHPWLSVANDLSLSQLQAMELLMARHSLEPLKRWSLKRSKTLCYCVLLVLWGTWIRYAHDQICSESKSSSWPVAWKWGGASITPRTKARILWTVLAVALKGCLDLFRLIPKS